MSQLLACAATLAVALASPLPVAAPASARSRVRAAMTDPGSEARRSPRLRTRQHLLVATAEEAAAGASSSPRRPAASPSSSSSPLTSWFVRHRSLLLLVALVVHKCTTDGLTRWTRLQTSYSGATVAVLSEVFKFPLIIAAVSTLGGGASQIIPVFRGAIAKPLGNCWIALCYTFNNLLYYDALSTLSAVAYQVRGHTFFAEFLDPALWWLFG
jgi:UDP-sugar transporter A1/2/3